MTDVILVTVECARWASRPAFGALDGTLTRGVAPGHYTRPSLAGLHGGRWRAVCAARCDGPTLAEAFGRAGYDTAAVSYSPQTTDACGFGRGFDMTRFLDLRGGPLTRGSAWRERLASVGVVRRLKRRLHDKHATFTSIPRDDMVVSHAATELTRDRDNPLFLWVHLMGSHRPYGWGAGALPEADSLAAANAGPGSPVSDETAQAVRDAYHRALKRTVGHLTALSDAAGDDAVLVAAGDHGEELGEAGYWFHGPWRRRVPNTITDVPVYSRGLPLPDGVSLLDLPAHLCDRVAIDTPNAWNARRHREHELTIAPWNGRATLRYRADGADVTFRDGDLPAITESWETGGRAVREQLDALGYMGVG